MESQGSVKPFSTAVWPACINRLLSFTAFPENKATAHRRRRRMKIKPGLPPSLSACIAVQCISINIQPSPTVLLQYL
ncbi:mCG141245 [Mus musculus]|nr:mCG141245 [Mus musculus]